MAKRKKAKVFEELNGLSQQEQARIISKNIRDKKYSSRQFKVVTDAFKENPDIIKVMIESLRVLKSTSDSLTERQNRAFKEACTIAEKTINNPNSTEKERVKAIELIDHWYTMLTSLNVMTLVIVFAAILFILAKVFDIVIPKDK